MIISGKEVSVSGNFIKILRLKNEYYENLDNPEHFINILKSHNTRYDLFTFIQKIGNNLPKYNYFMEKQSISLLYITTYNNWWEKQIKSKTRNMIRKSQKMGVDVRIVPYTDDLMLGIKEIYDESKIRQGRIFKHYGKNLTSLKRSHTTFLEHSQFFGAYLKDELIGFIKLVTIENRAHIMQIISKLSHRDKAPTNALIAKTVEFCEQKQIPILIYGVWSIGGLGDFKKNSNFERVDIPRYYIPMSCIGKLALKFGIHRSIKKSVPYSILSKLIDMRRKWLEFKYRKTSLDNFL